MQYRRIPFAHLGAYGPEFPNSSYLSGDKPIAKTVVLRADNSKLPGIPGLIQWIAQVHPDVYNYAFALMPHNVRIVMNRLKTGAANLTGSNAALARVAQVNRSTSHGTMLKPAPGLGYNFNAPLMNTTFDAGSLPLPPMVSIAATGESSGLPGLTPTGTSQLISSLAQAGQAIITGIDQQRIFNVQLQRAQNNQPPLNTAAYFSTTGNVIASSMPLLWVGGGVLALWFLTQRKKKTA